MDKLKNNLFVPGVALVVLLLLGGGYLLIFVPKGELDANSKKLTATEKKLSRLLKSKVLPTKEYVRKITTAQVEMEETFEEAVSVFSRRCDAFQLFFADESQVPAVSVFYAQYETAIQNPTTGLRAKYWGKFPSPTVEGEEEDLEKKSPTVEMVKDTEISGPEGQAKMGQAMKQYWISEAVFEACHQLGIGGLQSIEFPVEKERTSRRGSKKEEVDVPKSKASYDKVGASVLIHMEYSKLKGLLAVLYKNSRVPFLEPKSVEFGKIEDSVKDFSKYIRQQTFQSRALADAAEKAGEPAAQEPLVKVRLELVALDWKGVERSEDDSENIEDEDG